MAKYDLPAAFRYINNITNRKIHYIGHSQGTLIMFIALSQKIKGVEENMLSFNAFGPVAYLQYQKSKLLSSLSKTRLVNGLHVNQFKLRLLKFNGCL
jgi:poly(3-hydroxyalkanoate) synthetase